ncbi:hypothetical protein [Ekhidna sp.]
MNKPLAFILLLTCCFSCVKIPQESIDLSKTLGRDLGILHNSHRNSVEIIYSKIKEDINLFIDDVYAPFIINYVVSSEMNSFKEGKESIFKSLTDAAQSDTKQVTDKALNDIADFQKAAYGQILIKRKELLTPVEEEEREVLQLIDNSYNNMVHANATITGYLESVKKVRTAQKEGLAMVGLENMDEQLTNRLVSMSGKINSYLDIAKQIDIKSNEAKEEIEEISKKIKEVKNQ